MGLGIDTGIGKYPTANISLLPVGISGYGFYVPENCVDNQELETLVETSDAWIREKIGIRTRHIATDDQALSDLCIEASRKAIENAGLGPGDIDVLVLTGQNHDYKAPATANIVQHALGLRNIPAFDISIGCSGFIYGLSVASKYVADGSAKNVLLVSGEIHSRMFSWQDRSTCVFFADGAVAVVLSVEEADFGLLSFDLGTDGSQAGAIIVPAGGSRMPFSENSLRLQEEAPHEIRAPVHVRMDGRAVYQFAIQAFPRSVRASLAKLDCKTADLDFVIAHQANVNIIREGMQQLGLPMSKTYMNIERYGNCSSASIPIAMAEAADLGLIRRGDLVAFVGFGVGLSWGAVIVRWS